MAKKKPDRDPAPDSHFDCIYNQNGVTIYRQGYGFDQYGEMTDSEVADVIKENGLSKLLTKEGKSTLRGYL